jgi:hypothetical protein
VRLKKCPDCGEKPSYRSLYDSFCCLDCDKWLEPDHCIGAKPPCKEFLHTTGRKPSEAARSKSDF